MATGNGRQAGHQPTGRAWTWLPRDHGESGRIGIDRCLQRPAD